MTRRTKATPVCVDFDYCPDCGGVGQDYNLDFWCSACGGGGTVSARLCHYEVFSPELLSGGIYDPPEPFHCWGIYLAPSARAAKVMAVKDDEFKPWLRDTQGEPPFKGLTARLFRCEHGVCVACGADPEEHPCGFACSECDIAALAWDREGSLDELPGMWDKSDLIGGESDAYCCRGECCGPGSWCCAHAGPHSHDPDPQPSASVQDDRNLEVGPSSRAARFETGG